MYIRYSLLNLPKSFTSPENGDGGATTPFFVPCNASTSCLTRSSVAEGRGCPVFRGVNDPVVRAASSNAFFISSYLSFAFCVAHSSHCCFVASCFVLVDSVAPGVLLPSPDMVFFPFASLLSVLSREERGYGLEARFYLSKIFIVQVCVIVVMEVKIVSWVVVQFFSFFWFFVKEVWS